MKSYIEHQQFFFSFNLKKKKATLIRKFENLKAAQLKVPQTENNTNAFCNISNVTISIPNNIKKFGIRSKVCDTV